MKKRIFAALVLLLILVIPMPTGVAQDGGSRSYTALTYKIVDWSHTYAGGVYDETKVYPFPMNFRSMDELLTVEKQNFVTELPTEPDNSEPAIVYPKDIPFAAQYIRTDGYHEDVQYPVVTAIRSAEALNEYYLFNRTRYSMERRENPAADYTVGFLDACDMYDSTFFEENSLLLVLLEEGSGSIRHIVSNVCRSDQDALRVCIDSIVPEVGTCDMAQWHIFVEVPKEELTGEVEIFIDAELQYVQHPNEIIYDISLQKTMLHTMDGSYPISGEYATTVAGLLESLTYSPYRVCKCLPQYKIDIDDVTYGIHLTEGYARCDAGQAKLTAEQIDLLQETLAWTVPDQ